MTARTDFQARCSWQLQVTSQTTQTLIFLADHWYRSTAAQTLQLIILCYKPRSPMHSVVTHHRSCACNCSSHTMHSFLVTFAVTSCFWIPLCHRNLSIVTRCSFSPANIRPVRLLTQVLLTHTLPSFTHTPHPHPHTHTHPLLTHTHLITHPPLTHTLPSLTSSPHSHTHSHLPLTTYP